MNQTISVTMLGTGSPRPDLNRSGPSQALQIGDQTVLIDCGDGTTTQLLRANFNLADINVLFLTHLHSDHLLGYGQFLLGGWGYGRRKLTVVGPKGTKYFHQTLINLFEKDIDYRVSLGRPENGILDVDIIEIDQPCTLENIVPAKVITEQMVHNVPTFGYRFEIDEKVVVISGDTAPTPNIIKLSKNADILIQDACLAKNERYRNTNDPELIGIWKNLQKEHCTPEQAGHIAQEAGVKKLIMTHFLPNIVPEEAWKEAKSAFDGEVIVAEDLQRVFL